MVTFARTVASFTPLLDVVDADRFLKCERGYWLFDIFFLAHYDVVADVVFEETLAPLFTLAGLEVAVAHLDLLNCSSNWLQNEASQ